jgi:bacillithiol biosynthesis deacetylase BshB1
MKLDLIVFAVHPDDAELSCAGTIAKMVAAGKKVGIVDLTRGELGSRGSAEIRAKEAARAGEILGIAVRENLGMRDGFFVQDEASMLAIVQVIRRYQPEMVIANAVTDRHPDHGRASKLVRDAAFLAGLRRIKTFDSGQPQEAWRPKRTFYYIQDTFHRPDFVVDITAFWDKKKAAIQAFASQFFDPNSTYVEQPDDAPITHISSEAFWLQIEARARTTGHFAGVPMGEGFTSEPPLLIGDPLMLL